LYKLIHLKQRQSQGKNRKQQVVCF